MQAADRISRRRMFEILGAAGGLSLAGRVRLAWAQSTKRIERLAPELDAIIDISGGKVSRRIGNQWIGVEIDQIRFSISIELSSRFCFIDGCQSPG